MENVNHNEAMILWVSVQSRSHLSKVSVSLETALSRPQDLKKKKLKIEAWKKHSIYKKIRLRPGLKLVYFTIFTCGLLGMAWITDKRKYSIVFKTWFKWFHILFLNGFTHTVNHTKLNEVDKKQKAVSISVKKVPCLVFLVVLFVFKIVHLGRSIDQSVFIV